MGYRGLQCSRLENSMEGYNPWSCKESDTTERRTQGASQEEGGFVPILLLWSSESQWPRNMALFLTSRLEQIDAAFVPCQDPLFWGRHYWNPNGAETAFRKHFWRRAQRERWEERWNRKRPGTQRRRHAPWGHRMQDTRWLFPSLTPRARHSEMPAQFLSHCGSHREPLLCRNPRVLWHPPLPSPCPHFLFLQTHFILAQPRLLSPWGRERKHFLLCAKTKQNKKSIYN